VYLRQEEEKGGEGAFLEQEGGTHTTELFSFSQGFMSGVCLSLQMGALAVMHRCHRQVALLQSQRPCTSPLVGSRQVPCLVLPWWRGLCADPQETPALDLSYGLRARPAPWHLADRGSGRACSETVAWRGTCSCIHFTVYCLGICL